MRVVKLRGAGEALGGRNMLSSIRGEDLPYLAEIRPIGIHTYAESVRDARNQLAAVDAAGDPYVLVGYSLGAAAAGDFVQYDRPRNCKGIVLLSDPKRHANQVSHKGVPAGRWGIAGQRFIDRVPCYSYTIPDDPISALPGDNGMRQIGQQVTGLHQPLPARWWDAGYTIHWLLKYTTGGRHTAYGTERINGSSYLQSVKAMVEGLAG
ncbi:alpha/beta hydrolase [Gordonia sp. WA4-43]|uniref:alpha/beta hydrolase n=1 Tax=Gordonia sp. WA4-43 TaxID=2878678 RepID=UPI001CFAA63A|nr:alpha/beta hydrolase [Gordonia sp. WA4-43]UCZ89075.1 alpha/beta hydrolase [Gordonia sp. WA4-43]